MKTVTADVLVLGGGLAGGWAAIKAKEAGKDVVVIDKGKIGRSGSGGASPSSDSDIEHGRFFQIHRLFQGRPDLLRVNDLSCPHTESLGEATEFDVRVFDIGCDEPPCLCRHPLILEAALFHRPILSIIADDNDHGEIVLGCRP